jgi:hypothetical protein
MWMIKPTDSTDATCGGMCTTDIEYFVCFKDYLLVLKLQPCLLSSS